MKEKNVVNALPDNKSAQDEVKNHETNFVNVSSRQPVQKHETESSNEAFEAELPICKVVVQEIDQEDAINQVVSVNIPEIRVDISDDSTDSVEDPQAEWEWEDGEELGNHISERNGMLVQTEARRWGTNAGSGVETHRERPAEPVPCAGRAG